ncbi:hypothetical protein Voja6_00031 [Pseudomonas phage vB_PpuM-Voja-6]
MFKHYVSGPSSKEPADLPPHLAHWHKHSTKVMSMLWTVKSTPEQMKERRVAHGSIQLTELKSQEGEEVGIHGYTYPMPDRYLIHISNWAVYRGKHPSNEIKDWLNPDHAYEVYEFTTINEAFAFLALFTADKICVQR